MPTYLTFDEIEERAAAFHAAANSPSAIACLALEVLRAVLEHLTGAERDDLLNLIQDELADLGALGPQQSGDPRPYGGGLRLLGCPHERSCRTVQECLALMP